MTELPLHRRRLLGIAYRMTGSVADAEDIVQETFLRALGRPPPVADDLGPWLVTVALNLSRDRLRQRKREAYRGPWLPAPIDANELEPPTPEDRTTEARYSMLESVSFAFLLALEVLTPRERAVLLLRDVLDYSAKETATAIESTEGAVKVQLLRARRKIAGYEATRGTADYARTQTALVAFLSALRDDDARALEALLAEDAVAKTDAGGEYLAAGVDLIGNARISKALRGVSKKAPPLLRFELRVLNGMPFFVGEQDPRTPRDAPRFAMACELDRDGKIRAFYTVLASRKLGGIWAPTA